MCHASGSLQVGPAGVTGRSASRNRAGGYLSRVAPAEHPLVVPLASGYWPRWAVDAEVERLQQGHAYSGRLREGGRDGDVPAHPLVRRAELAGVGLPAPGPPAHGLSRGGRSDGEHPSKLRARVTGQLRSCHDLSPRRRMPAGVKYRWHTSHLRRMQSATDPADRTGTIRVEGLRHRLPGRIPGVGVRGGRPTDADRPRRVAFVDGTLRT